MGNRHDHGGDFHSFAEQILLFSDVRGQNRLGGHRIFSCRGDFDGDLLRPIRPGRHERRWNDMHRLRDRRLWILDFPAFTGDRFDRERANPFHDQPLFYFLTRFQASERNRLW